MDAIFAAANIFSLLSNVSTLLIGFVTASLLFVAYKHLNKVLSESNSTSFGQERGFSKGDSVLWLDSADTGAYYPGEVIKDLGGAVRVNIHLPNRDTIMDITPAKDVESGFIDTTLIHQSKSKQ